MARLRVRDHYMREFEINVTARDFWPDVEVIGGPIPDLDDEPEEPVEAAPVESPPSEAPPGESGATKPGRAAKPAEK